MISGRRSGAKRQAYFDGLLVVAIPNDCKLSAFVSDELEH